MLCSGAGTSPISIPYTIALDWHEDFSESGRTFARMNDCDQAVPRKILTGLWSFGSPVRETDPGKINGLKQALATSCSGSGNSTPGGILLIKPTPLGWEEAADDCFFLWVQHSVDFRWGAAPTLLRSSARPPYPHVIAATYRLNFAK